VHVDVLHRDLLLAFAAVTSKRIEQQRIAAGELVRFAQVLAPALKGAVARKLAVILYRMWIDGTEFNWSMKKAAA
jgi:transposase